MLHAAPANDSSSVISQMPTFSFGRRAIASSSSPRLHAAVSTDAARQQRSSVVCQVAAPGGGSATLLDAPPAPPAAPPPGDEQQPNDSGRDSTEAQPMDLPRSAEQAAASVPEPTGGRLLPGEHDDALFKQHWSVAYWRDRGAAYPAAPEAEQILGTVSDAVRRQVADVRDATSAAYWAYHTARWGFFTSQLAGSVVACSLSTGRLMYVLGPLDAEGAGNLAWGLTAEAFGAFECDLRNIKEGAYKLPWDMTTPGHRQFNPFTVLSQSIKGLLEFPDLLARRLNPEDGVGLLPFERSPLYPGYYQNNFHFQTDGWFSSQSADMYEYSTELLFVGRQDAMQRGTLLALNRHFPGSNGAGLDMLEVGAGTGRVATFVRDNYPAARLTVSDLSPFYLEKAASSMAYWERCASPSARSAGSVSFVQCAAEALPQADACMDVVYSVYMFHEMPADVRRAALREFARVLKPGGVLVITDSIQEGDRAGIDDLRKFSGMNEPHYLNYLEFDFGSEMQEAGLEPGWKSLSSASKSLTAVKR